MTPATSAVTGRFAATPMVRAKLRREALAGYIALGMLICILLPLFAIVGDLVWQALPSLTWQFLTAAPSHGMREGGVWPAFIGTLYLVTLSLAAPIGVLAAVYLTEYATDNWFNRAVNIAVLNLAGVPSIVHALFALGAFVYGARLGFSVLSASLTLAIMTMPVIIASTREALLSVPQSYREACWNLGASRWQTIRTIVLPGSISGILTGVILQVSRAAGETAPIMFTVQYFPVPVAEAQVPHLNPVHLPPRERTIARRPIAAEFTRNTSRRMPCGYLPSPRSFSLRSISCTIRASSLRRRLSFRWRAAVFWDRCMAARTPKPARATAPAVRLRKANPMTAPEASRMRRQEAHPALPDSSSSWRLWRTPSRSPFSRMTASSAATPAVSAWTWAMAS